MKRAASILLVAAYLVIASIPLWSRVVGVREQRINGAFERLSAPSPRPGAMLDERFQREFTAWFERYRGLLGHAVHLDNTVLYRVFGETRVGARVRLGRGKVLFIDEDIDFLNRREQGIPSASELARLVDEIAAVQASLRAGGRALVPIIIPAKTTLYRDAVDARWRRRFVGAPPSDRLYQELVAMLEARGVAFVDMRADLGASTAARRDLWVAEARHWSQYGACLANTEIVARAAMLLGRAPLPYRCELVRDKVGRTHDDFDLWRLLNTWQVRREALTAPRGEHAAASGAVTPLRILYVGTSFNWSLIRDAVLSHVLAPVHMHYYDSQMIAWPQTTSEQVAAGDPAWAAMVADKDVFVLDLLEPSLWSGHVYYDNFLREAGKLAPTLAPRP